MNPRLIAALADGLKPAIGEAFKNAVKPLLVRLALIEARAPEKGDKGENGKDADPALIARLVAEEVAKIPPAPAGKDAEPEAVAVLVAAEVQRAVAALPVPQNGKDADPALIARLVAEEVAKIPPAPAGAAGVGLAGAVIDREGVLVITLSDGSHHSLGEVVGKPGEPGKNGDDGLGFDDLNVLHDGEREITFRFARGEQVKEFAFSFPTVIDRGVWREGEWKRGDGVTWGGSFWIAQRDNPGKPDTPESGWRLAVKRGRDGKDGKPGERGERGEKGDRGEIGPRGFGG